MQSWPAYKQYDPEMEALRSTASSSLREHDIEAALGRAFLAARVVTGSSGQAEIAILEGIDLWDPETDGAEKLLHLVLRAALRAPQPFEPAGAVDDTDEPPQLLAVLRLPPVLRSAFVLRTLTGCSAGVCSGLLGISRSEVEERVCRALKLLPSLRGPTDPNRKEIL